MQTPIQESGQLAILGSYPPPYGGVGVHVQRLCPLLEDRGIPYRVYNATSDYGDGKRVIGVFSRRRTWFIQYLFTARESAIYILSGRLLAWVIGALMASWRGKRVLLRLRNASLPDWVEAGGVKRFLATFALRRMTGVVCVSKLLMESARRLGVDESRLHWSPGFLPPDARQMDRASVNPEVWPFIERHSPVIAANGRIDQYRGEDLYGLDLLVELADRLKTDYPQVGIVICFWDHQPGDQARLDALIETAHRKGVGDNVLFNTQSGPFVPVLDAADVFARPTNTDGDANSIREALFLGVPAVASDAVERPAGCHLFRSRDPADFEAKVREALKNSRGQAGGAATLPPEDRERIDRYLNLLESAVINGEVAR